MNDDVREIVAIELTRFANAFDDDWRSIVRSDADAILAALAEAGYVVVDREQFERYSILALELGQLQYERPGVVSDEVGWWLKAYLKPEDWQHVGGSIAPGYGDLDPLPVRRGE